MQSRVVQFSKYAEEARQTAIDLSESLSDRAHRAALEAKHVFANAMQEQVRTLTRSWSVVDHVGWSVVSLRPVLPPDSYRWLFDEVVPKFAYMHSDRHAVNLFVAFMCPFQADHVPLLHVAAVYAYVTAAGDSRVPECLFPVKFMSTPAEISAVVSRLTQQCFCSLFPWPVVPLCPIPPETGLLPGYVDSRLDWFKDCFFFQFAPTFEIASLILSLTLRFFEITPRLSHVFALLCSRLGVPNSNMFKLHPLYRVTPPAVGLLSGLPVSEVFSDLHSPAGLSWSSQDCAWVKYTDEDPASDWDSYIICPDVSALPSLHRTPYVDFLTNLYVECMFPVGSQQEVALRLDAVTLRLDELSKLEREVTELRVTSQRDATELVESARAGGDSGLSIAFRHVLPNALSPGFAQASITMGFSIIIAAGLSFIGAGVQPPTPEWGAMIASGAGDIINGKWWASLFPGIAMSLTVFGFAVIGETLQAVLMRKTD